jgi:hypothetical protein
VCVCVCVLCVRVCACLRVSLGVRYSCFIQCGTHIYTYTSNLTLHPSSRMRACARACVRVTVCLASPPQLASFFELQYAKAPALVRRWRTATDRIDAKRSNSTFTITDLVHTMLNNIVAADSYGDGCTAGSSGCSGNGSGNGSGTTSGVCGFERGSERGC